MGNQKARLYIGGLSYSATEEDLKEAFKPYGKVIEAKVVTDRETGKARGFGFIEMGSPAEAEKALALDGNEILGRRISVSFAREKQR